jgi:thiamine pyrophosphokinase
MKVLILANGELYKPGVLRSRVCASVFDLVFATDGGARYASTLNVTLDAIIGDMDSLSDLEQQDTNNAEIISHPVEKNETDLELAIIYAEKQGADQIVIVGAMGRRMDMTIANILLITRASLRSCRIEVWHAEQTGWIIKPPSGNISGHPGDTISLIPIAGCASAITTNGLKYPLKNEELSYKSARGISNLMDKPTVHITLSEGLLLAIHTPGKA